MENDAQLLQTSETLQTSLTLQTSPTLQAKILIVDDLALNVRVLEQILLNAHYTSIMSTTDPTQVFALHSEHQFDLILLDIEMEPMDGFAVMHQLKSLTIDDYLPVIVITSQVDYKLRALQVGAKDFLSTPFDRAEVLARVHNLIEVRLLHKASKQHERILEQKVVEIEMSRDLLRTQGTELKRLFDEVIAEQKRVMELSLQPGTMVGVEKEERLNTSILRSLILRHPWLQLNLLTAFAAGAVVGLFQHTIDHLLILTIFLPVLAGQSGNTGSQALAITLRGMTLGNLKSENQSRVIRKEALLGLMNGALVGLLAGLGMYIIASWQNLTTALSLSLVVFLAMIGSCVISGICGAAVPMILKRIGADPVTASTIFLTTATDMVSMGMLLGFAAAIVPF